MIKERNKVEEFCRLSDDWGNLTEYGTVIPFGIGRIGRRVIPTPMKEFYDCIGWQASGERSIRLCPFRDAYFGAPSSNGKRGRGTDKTSALAAVSLTGEGHPLFLKIQVSKLDAESVRAVDQQIVCSGTEIHSDALRSFHAHSRESTSITIRFLISTAALYIGFIP